jgi:hypothetical protein
MAIPSLKIAVDAPTASPPETERQERVLPLATVCPPVWVLQLARLRPDDEAVMAHVENCRWCAAVFWSE